MKIGTEILFAAELIQGLWVPLIRIRSRKAPNDQANFYLDFGFDNETDCKSFVEEVMRIFSSDNMKFFKGAPPPDNEDSDLN